MLAGASVTGVAGVALKACTDLLRALRTLHSRQSFCHSKNDGKGSAQRGMSCAASSRWSE